MKVTINEATTDKITFSCNYGGGMGIPARPDLEEGMKCDVEINVLAELVVGVNVKISNDNHPYVRIEGDETVFNIKVESIDDEDIWLRLSTDFILVVEEIKGSVKVGEMLRISLKFDEMEIYTVGS